MICRKAQESDFAAIVKIWQQAFADPEDFIYDCLYTFAGLSHVYVAEDRRRSRLAAQLLAVPCKANNKRGVYLYALATDKEYQKQGIMSALMTYAEGKEQQKGVSFFSLIPGSAPLYRYYQKRGYNEEVQLRLLHRQAGKSCFAAESIALTAQNWAALRKTHVKVDYIDFGMPQYTMLLDDLKENGFAMVASAGGYAIYATDKDKLLVPELFAADDGETDNLLAAMAQKTGVHKALITLSPAGPFAKDQGQPMPGGLYKQVDTINRLHALYMRFGFDEIKETMV